MRLHRPLTPSEVRDILKATGTPQAADDPRAHVPAWEGVVGAATATYGPSARSNGRPVYTAIPISSAYAAFVGVSAIALALVARERDGLGQRICRQT